MVLNSLARLYELQYVCVIKPHHVSPVHSNTNSAVPPEHYALYQNGPESQYISQLRIGDGRHSFECETGRWVGGGDHD